MEGGGGYYPLFWISKVGFAPTVWISKLEDIPPILDIKKFFTLHFGFKGEGVMMVFSHPHPIFSIKSIGILVYIMKYKTKSNLES